MKQYAAIALLVLTVSQVAGCEKEPLKPHSVVINILEIAETTGFNAQMIERAKTSNQQISEEMKALSDKLRKEFEDEKSSFGDSPSEEDEKKIKALRQQLGKQIIVARNENNARRTEEVSAIRQAFLDEVMSVAQKAALEHGASIILKANGVLWSDGAVEITDEVIGRMTGDEEPTPADGELLPGEQGVL